MIKNMKYFGTEEENNYFSAWISSFSPILTVLWMGKIFWNQRLILNPICGYKGFCCDTVLEKDGERY